jgi:hypothetical protein
LDGEKNKGEGNRLHALCQVTLHIYPPTFLSGPKAQKGASRRPSIA